VIIILGDAMIWIVLIIAIVLGAFGQIFMKEAMKIAGPVPMDSSSGDIFYYFMHSLFSFRMALAALSYGLSFILWLGVLSLADLSLIRPLMSFGYLITMLYGFYAGENVTLERAAGTLLIIAGIFFVTRSGFVSS
jgi:drug/metabolite transporter (DMT)-like permease